MKYLHIYKKESLLLFIIILSPIIFIIFNSIYQNQILLKNNYIQKEFFNSNDPQVLENMKNEKLKSLLLLTYYNDITQIDKYDTFSKLKIENIPTYNDPFLSQLKNYYLDVYQEENINNDNDNELFNNFNNLKFISKNLENQEFYSELDKKLFFIENIGFEDIKLKFKHFIDINKKLNKLKKDELE